MVRSFLPFFSLLIPHSATWITSLSLVLTLWMGLATVTQAQVTVWRRTIGGTYDDLARAVTTTPDGGYVVAGGSFSTDGDVSGARGFGDFWVVKLNSSGNLVWQKTLGGTRSEEARAITTTADGGFLVAGSTLSEDGDVKGYHGSKYQDDVWVVKLDCFGNLIWQ